MAFLKSIILFALLINWAKAAQFQYDIDAEFNRIFHQIRHTMDNAWRWMREAANNSYLRINEIFTARKAIEQGRHKYQDVAVPNETPIKPEDAQIQSETILVPLIANPGIPKLTTMIPSAAPELPNSSPEITPVNQPESANLQKVKENEPETESANLQKTKETEPETESANLQKTKETEPETESANLPKSKENEPETEPANLPKSKEAEPENVASKIPENPTSKEQPEPECEDSANEDTTTAAVNTKVDAQTQTESQIPLEPEHDTNKLELPIVQDIGAVDSLDVEKVSEPDDKIKIIEPAAEKEESIIVADPPDHIEFEMKRGLSRSIYEQQNIIILFLFFLIIIMSAYFFLLSRTPHTCPTIVIGELGNNLKSGMHNIKK